MKQEFKREAKLQAICCDIASFKVVVDRIISSFDDEALYFSLSLTKDNHTLKFDSFGDLKMHLLDLPAIVTDVRLYVSQCGGDRSRSVWLYPSISYVSLIIESDDEAWNAGVFETFSSFSRKHRPWYAHLRPRYLFTAPIVLFIAPLIMSKILDLALPVGVRAVFWLLSALTYVIPFYYDKLFPQLVLILTNREPWLKKHTSEIIVIATIITAVAAVIGAIAAF